MKGFFMQRMLSGFGVAVIMMVATLLNQVSSLHPNAMAFPEGNYLIQVGSYRVGEGTWQQQRGREFHQLGYMDMNQHHGIPKVNPLALIVQEADHHTPLNFTLLVPQTQHPTEFILACHLKTVNGHEKYRMKWYVGVDEEEGKSEPVLRLHADKKSATLFEVIPHARDPNWQELIAYTPTKPWRMALTEKGEGSSTPFWIGERMGSTKSKTTFETPSRHSYESAIHLIFLNRPWHQVPEPTPVSSELWTQPRTRLKTPRLIDSSQRWQQNKNTMESARIKHAQRRGKASAPEAAWTNWRSIRRPNQMSAPHVAAIASASARSTTFLRSLP